MNNNEETKALVQEVVYQIVMKYDNLTCKDVKDILHEVAEYILEKESKNDSREVCRNCR